jgi:signal transduction histidine kinase/MFS family permease
MFRKAQKMTGFTISMLIVSIGSFLLALFVHSRGRQSAINTTWALFSASVGVWSFGYFGFLLSSTKGEAFVWIRILYCGAILIPTLCFHFICVLLQCFEKKKKLIVASYALSVVFEIANLTPYFVKDLRPILNFKWWPVPGPLFACFVVHFILMLSYGIYLTTKNYRIASTRQKNQMLYLALGIGIAFIGGSTNYLSIYGLPVFPIGNIFVVALPALVAYAIVKHHLMDISIIIRKTLVFAGMFALFMAIVSLVTALTQSYVGKSLHMGPMATSLLSVLIAIFLYDPTRRLLVNITDRYLFQKKFSLTSIVAQASEAIALVQSLKWLSRRIIAFLVTKCRIKNALVYIRSRENELFVRGAIRGYLNDGCPPEELDAMHPVIQHLKKHRRFIEITRLEESLQKKDLPADVRGQLDAIMAFLKASRAEVIIPSFLHRRIEMAGIGKEKHSEDEEVSLRNILVLGGKKSDEQYSDEDLNVFYGLAQESAFAIENARLYDEAVERTRLLEVTNRDLTDANERLKVTQASLIVAEKNATMVGMAKAIGHEVNNPLSTVAGRATWIYRDDLPVFKDILNDDPIAITPEYVKKMKKAYSNIDNNARKVAHSAKRIEVVVKTLTDILKDTKGEIGPLSLLVLFREAREATRFVTYEENLSGCQIQEDIASNLIIMGNLEQLLQVFVNLIKNAYEAMGKQPNRLIIVRAHPDPDDAAVAKIEVEDNGPGMPPEVLANIWKQGFSTKIRESDQIGAAGQGQGLFICKHMIESVHSGSISAKSVLGQGTTFIIKLPLADLGG